MKADKNNIYIKANKKPRKSDRFGIPTIYYDGVYYFITLIEENTNSKTNSDYPFILDGCFYRSGKWQSDCFQITG